MIGPRGAGSVLHFFTLPPYSPTLFSLPLPLPSQPRFTQKRKARRPRRPRWRGRKNLPTATYAS
jgi:hypothetical protein